MKNKRHILFLSSWYPNRLDVASGNFIKRTAELIAQRHEVTVLFFKADSTISKHEVVKNRTGNLTEIIVYYPKKKSLYAKLFQLKNYKKAIDLGLEELTSQPDLIHANVAYPKGREFVYIAKKLKTDYILTELSSDYYFENRVKWSKIKKQEIIRTLRKARVILPTSVELEKDMLEVEPHLSRAIIPLTVDPNLFFPRKEKRNDGFFNFLHISGLDERYKNVKGIVEAFSMLHHKHPNTKLTIVTDSKTDALVQFMTDKQLQKGVEIITDKKFEEVAKIYRENDCFVLFSNYETFSCVAVEALASGLQLISTDVGVVSALSNDLVYKVIPKDIKKLSEAMLSVYENELAIPSEILANSVEFCHEKVVLDRLLALYEDVIQTEYA